MLKFLFLGLLLYLALRATRNLVVAMLQDRAAQQRVAPPPPWQRPARPEPSTKVDIEDARWQDLEE